MSDFVDEQIDADMSPELAPGAEIDARNVEEAASQEMRGKSSCSSAPLAVIHEWLHGKGA